MSYIPKRGHNTTWRDHLIRNLCCNLIQHNKIETTIERARIVSLTLSKLITRAKTDTLANRRFVGRYLFDVEAKANQTVLQKLFLEIAPKYKTVNGGYLGLYRKYIRRGDNALIAILTFK